LRSNNHLSGRGTYLVSRIRSGAGSRRGVRAGVPDRPLAPDAGLAAVAGLCGRLGVIAVTGAAAGLIKERDRGFGAGGLLAGIAAAQLAGRTSWPGWAASGPVRRGSSSPRCRAWRPRPRRAWPGGSPQVSSR